MYWEFIDLEREVELLKFQQESMKEINNKSYDLMQKHIQSRLGKIKEEPYIVVYKSKEIRGVTLELVTFNPRYVFNKE